MLIAAFDKRNKENVVIQNFKYKHKLYERDGFISNNSMKINENTCNFLMGKWNET